MHARAHTHALLEYTNTFYKFTVTVKVQDSLCSSTLMSTTANVNYSLITEKFAVFTKLNI